MNKINTANTMTLTRRMYVLEEVSASLRCSLRKQRLEESLFWLEELELSCEEEIAKYILLEMWAMRKGVRWMSWLLSWCELNSSYEGRRSLVTRFCTHSRDILDSSIYISYILGIHMNSKEKKGQLSETLQKIVNTLENYNTPLSNCILEWVKFLKPRIVPLDISCMAPCMDIIELEESIKKIGLRASRKYAIQCDVHLGYTSRGFDVSTRMEFTDLYSLLEHPVWAGLLEDYLTDDNEWLSDTSKEAFYDTYFGITGDIPDEWPSSEKEKSHGVPPASRTSFPLKRWWSTWIPEIHLYIFGKHLYQLNELLSETMCKECIPSWIQNRLASIQQIKRSVHRKEYVFED